MISCHVLSLKHFAKLVENHRDDLNVDVQEFDIGGKYFAFNNMPHFMGVVNLSPDSWYRESVCLTTKSAVGRGQLLIKQGAHLVDLGGESTVLDAEKVDAEDQSSRLVPVIKELAQAGILVSAETYKSSVARACLESGAAVINLTGPRESGEIYRMAAAHDAAVIICFVQGDNVRAVENRDLPEDPIPILKEYFENDFKVCFLLFSGPW